MFIDKPLTLTGETVAPTNHAREKQQVPDFSLTLTNIEAISILKKLRKIPPPPFYGTRIKTGIDDQLFNPMKQMRDSPNTRQAYDFSLNGKPVDLTQLKIDAVKANISGELAANFFDLPLAGMLLSRYVTGDGSPLVLSFSDPKVKTMMAKPTSGLLPSASLTDILYSSDSHNTHNGTKDNDHLKVLQTSLLQSNTLQKQRLQKKSLPQTELSQKRHRPKSPLHQLAHDVAYYFEHNPEITQLSAQSPWRSMQAVGDDAHNAFGYFYTGLAGHFTIEERLADGSIIIEGKIQGNVTDTYDFGLKEGEDLQFKGRTIVSKESLYYMGHPEANFAKPFDIIVSGPIESTRFKLSNTGEIEFLS